MELLRHTTKTYKVTVRIFLGVVAFFTTFFIGYFVLLQLTFISRVEGISMLPTVPTPVHALMYKTSDVQYDDIVTIETATENDPDSPGLFKRIIGLGGDELIYMYDKDYLTFEGRRVYHLYRKSNGSNFYIQVDESYILEPMYNAIAKPMEYSPLLTTYDFSQSSSDDETQFLQNVLESKITVKENYVYFLGDNRNYSSDSRGKYGMQSINNVTGKMIMLIDETNYFHNLLLGLYG